MEISHKELVTLGIVLAGLATTWGMLKTKVSSILKELDELKKDGHKVDTRLDKIEARQAVALSAIDTMSKDILSPQILKQQSERDGAVEMRLRSLERETQSLHSKHNTIHPPVKEKK